MDILKLLTHIYKYLVLIYNIYVFSYHVRHNLGLNYIDITNLCYLINYKIS